MRRTIANPKNTLHFKRWPVMSPFLVTQKIRKSNDEICVTGQRLKCRVFLGFAMVRLIALTLFLKRFDKKNETKLQRSFFVDIFLLSASSLFFCLLFSDWLATMKCEWGQWRGPLQLHFGHTKVKIVSFLLGTEIFFV